MDLIKCACGWSGLIGELRLDKITNHTIQDILQISNWSHCPKCNSKCLTPLSTTKLNLDHHDTVLNISSTLGNTFLHLHRILDFNIEPHGLKIAGYKMFSNQIFNLNLLFSSKYESMIILEIINLTHKSRFKCETKIEDEMQLFGKWSKFTNSVYPFQPCSFCARYYEWKHQKKNGWPLHYNELEKEKLKDIRTLAGVPVHSNNKFARIFCEDQIIVKKICHCNETTKHPNPFCELHGSEEVPCHSCNHEYPCPFKINDEDCRIWCQTKANPDIPDSLYESFYSGRALDPGEDISDT